MKKKLTIILVIAVLMSMMSVPKAFAATTYFVRNSDNIKEINLTTGIITHTDNSTETWDFTSALINISATNSITVKGTNNNVYLACVGNCKLTLDNVSIDMRGKPGSSPLGFYNSGNVLTLVGNSTLIGEYDNLNFPGPGIGVESGDEVTIESPTNGSLTAIGGYHCAGIGGSDNDSAGTIIINGGNITATGGHYAAGLGGGDEGGAGNIIINGGNVTASGGYYAAGIGNGNNGDGGNVTINGGIVKSSTSSTYGVGIGSGYLGSTVNVNITGGEVYAEGGDERGYDIGVLYPSSNACALNISNEAVVFLGHNKCVTPTTTHAKVSHETISNNSAYGYSHFSTSWNGQTAYGYLPVYTVSFNSQGGSDVDDLTNVVQGSTISAPADPTQTGYIFAGWYKESECTNAWNFATNTVTADTTLYADWIAASDVTLDPNGGDGFAENTTTYEEGHTFNLPNEDYVGERAGYVPTGWNTLADGSGTHYDLGAEFTVPEDDTTLYVEWDANYTITYNLCGGTNNVANPAKYRDMHLPITLLDAVKDGFEFVGWYDNADYSGDIVSEIPEGSTGDKEYWARWTSREIVNGRLIVSYFRSDDTLLFKYVYYGTTTDTGIKNRCKYDASEVLAEMTAFDASARRTTLTKYHANGKAEYKYFYDVTTGKRKSMIKFTEAGIPVTKTEYYPDGASAKKQYFYYATGKKKIIKNFRTNKKLSSQTWFHTDGTSKKQFNTYDVNGNLTSVSKYYMNGTRYYYKKY